MTQINYDDLVQIALKQVVRQALEFVEKNGLVGNHHFYITFRTDHPDVAIPSYLLERHPEEITIVLQYQFWDLHVHAHGFEVTLSFNDIHERLQVPFDALTSFVDPSVKFGLQFVPIMTSTKKAPSSQPLLPSTADASEKIESADNVIMLDAFRKK